MSHAPVLLLSFPAKDLTVAASVCALTGQVLLPAGDVGDLGQAWSGMSLYIVETDLEGPRPAATWKALLADRICLDEPDLVNAIPPSWLADHPEALTAVRLPVFIPVTKLRLLPRAEWLFVNELVPKQARGGRRFVPRVPRLVTLPD